MAKEIYSSLNFTAAKNGASIAFDGSFSLTMAGNEMINRTQVIGTSSETLNFGDIAGSPGRVIIKNLDPTNYVIIGGDSGLTVFSIVLLPGQFATFQPTTGTIYAQADTADVRIQTLASEA